MKRPYSPSSGAGVVSTVLASALFTAPLSAAPFTDLEAERRMAEGANLSAVCRVEATASRTLGGEYCMEFLVWVRDDFPALVPNLRVRTSKASEHLKNYETNLAIILDLARSFEAAR